MENAAPISDTQMTKIGLLMEAAVAYQQSAEDALKRLKDHTQGIDSVVRDEIRRTMVDEFLTLGEEARRAAQALESVKRAVNVRMGLWSIAVTAACTGLALTALWWTLPNPAEIGALKAERDRYVTTVAELEHRGGRIDLRHCGEGSRLCVRIDPKAPTFGEHHDYLVVREN